MKHCLTERENALIAIGCGVPEWVPDANKIYKMIGNPFHDGVVFNGGLDCFGVRWVGKGMAVTPDPNQKLLKDIADWKKVFIEPEIPRWQWEKHAEEFLAAVDREQHLVEYGAFTCHFERMLALMGFEEAAVAMLEEPEIVHELLDAIDKFIIRHLEMAALTAKPDVFMFNDDVASSRGMMFSPQMYREVLKPHHKKVIQRAKELGMLVVQHSCGKCEDVVGEFVDNGADVWNNAQSINDIVAIQERYRGRLCIQGGMDFQGPVGLDTATDEMIRAEVHRCIDTYAPNGGYILELRLLGDMDDPAYLHRCRVLDDECTVYGHAYYKK